MRKRSFDVLFRCALLGSLLSLFAAASIAQQPDTPHAQSQDTPFITIEADYFEVDLVAERAYFTGNVAATQGNNTFRTSQLTLLLEQIIGQPENHNSTEQRKQRAPELFQLHAAELSYDVPNNIILASGNSELSRGGERIQADQISYNVERQMAFGTPEPGERVLVRFIANPQMPLFFSTTGTGAAGE